MEMDKKTIIIIVIVAVAAFLLWRKSKSATVTASGSTSVAPSTTTLDYILTHIDFNTTERNKIEAMRKACETSNTLRQQILAKANQNGLSYDQQLVCDAIWLLYYNDSDSSWNSDRGWKLIAEVKSL